ncbi:NADPH-dependent FMN reductase [Psychromonas sp. B3M02]|uniref:NADPH-dependent FMN reductase n=1 Tax=Psychromonas sp. B3M02 TaxID=2267226 RepID=UPI000DE9E37B|nr:NAD(P)H-dependent oxidoreductase [Psychromonas sp. B3M02]RBW47522.1 NADPH-dependent FMN reductase [Psychromonas sp. B3M02]
MKVLAFAASNSENSINQKLAAYTASLITDAEVELLDINDYEMPIYSIQREVKLGKPQQALDFYDKITEADAIIISFAEHNGSYTAAYKNLFDWTSRIDMKVYQDTPMLMLGTSPGPGGAASVLASASGSATYFAADVKGELSVPNFFDVFDIVTNKVVNKQLQASLIELVGKLGK